jgi:hypothetical protein
MSTIAADQPKGISVEKPQGLSGLIRSPAVLAALLTTLLGGLIALVGTVVGPMVATGVQNHEKSLEVRTALATDMSRSFTMAVGAGQRVASGLIYGPTGNRKQNAAVAQAAYNAGLGQWQVDGGRIAAELTARYRGDPIIQQWRLYRLAVTRFYRLSAVIPGDQRRFFVRYVRAYFKQMRGFEWARSARLPKNVKWGALERTKRFRHHLNYRRTYDKLSASFLLLGDAFVGQIVKLHPDV